MLANKESEPLKYFFKNQNGSALWITITGDSVDGTFATAVGKGVFIPRPIKGWKNGCAISLTVTFQEVTSVCAWVGTFDLKADKSCTIKT